MRRKKGNCFAASSNCNVYHPVLQVAGAWQPIVLVLSFWPSHFPAHGALRATVFFLLLPVRATNCGPNQLPTKAATGRRLNLNPSTQPSAEGHGDRNGGGERRQRQRRCGGRPRGVRVLRAEALRTRHAARGMRRGHPLRAQTYAPGTTAARCRFFLSISVLVSRSPRVTSVC